MKDFESIALSQAKTLNEQAARIQELIREVNTVKGDAHSARALAGKYALKAGMPADEESVRLAAVEDAFVRARLETEHHALEMFQDEIIRNVMINYLQKFEDAGLTAEQVQHVIKHIKAAHDGCRRYAEKAPKYHEMVGRAAEPPKSAQPKPAETYELPLFDGAA